MSPPWRAFAGEPSAIGLRPGQVIGAVADAKRQTRGPHADLPALPARTPAPAPTVPDGSSSKPSCDRRRAALRCHAHSATQELDIPYPQRHRFAPPDPAVRQREHQRAMVAELGSQPAHVLSPQVHTSLACLVRQVLHTARRVAASRLPFTASSRMPASTP